MCGDVADDELVVEESKGIELEEFLELGVELFLIGFV